MQSVSLNKLPLLALRAQIALQIAMYRSTEADPMVSFTLALSLLPWDTCGGRALAQLQPQQQTLQMRMQHSPGLLARTMPEMSGTGGRGGKELNRPHRLGCGMQGNFGLNVLTCIIVKSWYRSKVYTCTSECCYQDSYHVYTWHLMSCKRVLTGMSSGIYRLHFRTVNP